MFHNIPSSELESYEAYNFRHFISSIGHHEKMP